MPKRRARSRKTGLTDMQWRFVQELLADPNISATQAALNAGCSPRNPAQSARALQDTKAVQLELEKERKKLARKFDITKERVLEEIAKTAFVSMGDFLELKEDGTAVFDMNKMTPDMAAAMSEFQTEVYQEGRGMEAQDVKKIRLKLNDKLRALEMLCRHLGLFNDSMELKGEMTLVDRIQKGRERAAKRNKPEEDDGSPDK